MVVRLALRARSSSRRERASAELPEIAHLDRPPADPAVCAALRTLTTAQRDCIVLHHLDDLPVDTIAGLLHLPAGTVLPSAPRARSSRRAPRRTDPLDQRNPDAR
ncbi:MAG: sigma factor-like helix-turn-helix DNA-binding protein [Acidimicrobiales bacterium]